MTNARGVNATLMSRFQEAVSDTFSTPESAGDGTYHILPYYAFNISGTEEISEDEAISGEGGDSFPGDVVEGLRGVNGSLEVPLGVGSLGWHLAAMFGAPTTTGSDPNYSHVFEAPAIMAPRYLTYGVNYTDVSHYRRSSGITYTDMQLGVRKSGERARASFSAIGHDDTGVGSAMDATPVATFADEWVPSNFRAGLKRDGSEVTQVTGVDLTIGTGITADQEMLNGLPTAEDAILDRWSGSGSVTTRFADTSWIDLADAGTYFDLEVEWAQNANRSILLRVHNVRLARTGVPVQNRQIITQSFQFQVGRPDAADTPFTWTLKNGIAGYDNL